MKCYTSDEICELKRLEPYIFKLNYFRYNLSHSNESKHLHPLLVEKIMANAIKELREEMEEKNIHIPGYN